MGRRICTPLNATVGFSNLLSQVEDKEGIKEYAGTIETNTDLLPQLISDILDISEIESGVYDFHITRADASQMMSEIEQVGKLRIKSEELALTLDERLLQCILYTDKDRPAQVIISLLTNAIRFTPGGEIWMGYWLKDTTALYFYVSDTGCSMFTGQCEHMFERFAKYSLSIQGTELGLFVSRMIIEKLEGEIGITPKVNKDSLFRFTLPYRTSVQYLLNAPLF